MSTFNDIMRKDWVVFICRADGEGGVRLIGYNRCNDEPFRWCMSSPKHLALQLDRYDFLQADCDSVGRMFLDRAKHLALREGES